MIQAICSEIKNFFTSDCDRLIGDWTIEGGNFVPPIDFPSDYIRIVGSRKNDGVYKVSEITEGTFTDERFHGAVWFMCPPKDFLNLVEEIEQWNAKNGSPDSAAMSPFTSESFGGYSYSKSSGGSEGGKNPNSWQCVYASRLNQYRRARVL